MIAISNMVFILFPECKYDYPTVWPTCDATTNQATVSLVVKEGSPAECAPTQDKELTCDKLERIKAWQARKDAKKAKKEESKRLKEHKKTLKEKYSGKNDFAKDCDNFECFLRFLKQVALNRI